MSQDQRPGAITMADGRATAPGDVIVEEVGKAPVAAGKGGGMLKLLLFAIAAAGAGAAVARLGVGA